jgi:hypothetical protein
MTFDTAMFIVCILVISAFIFAAMRSPRICAIIFGELLAVLYFLLGYVYDGLPQYPQPHRIIGFCNYVPRIMNNTDLCPGSSLHPDGSYVTEELLLLVNPPISLFLVILQWLLPLIAVTLAYYLRSRPTSKLNFQVISCIWMSMSSILGCPEGL